MNIKRLRSSCSDRIVLESICVKMLLFRALFLLQQNHVRVRNIIYCKIIEIMIIIIRIELFRGSFATKSASGLLYPLQART